MLGSGGHCDKMMMLGWKQKCIC